ncbi:MAG: phospholipase D-like domain-containing protein [Acidimicrobiales bacterium]
MIGATVRTRSGGAAAPAAATVEPLAVLTTAEFVDELHHRLATARRRISIQLMTFDGDRSGQAVARALIAAAGRGVSVQVLLDCFVDRFVSDTPVRRPAVRDEHRATVAMYRRLEAAGVEVRYTHPNGRFRQFSLARNHKKVFLIDDRAYLGGVNVSDHNFGWHDLMVRIEEPRLVASLGADFRAGFRGHRYDLDGSGGEPDREPVPGVTAAWLVSNRAVERTFDEMVAGARRRVVVASPYAIDRHLVAGLEQCPAPERTVVISDDNNFRILRVVTPHLQHRLERAGVTVAAYHRFSHAKFLLADDRLLVGSSNYGRHSFWCNQEIGLVVDDPVFVADFVARILEDNLGSARGGHPAPARWLGAGVAVAMTGVLRAYGRWVAPRVPALADRR